MLLLVVGGAKSGKSMLAQCLCRALAGDRGRMVYLATLDPCDGEDRQRIARHRRDRDGWGFETLEEPYDLEKAAAALRGDEVVLLDSLTALLGNRMFGPRPQENPVADLDRGLEVLCRRAGGVVAVTDDLFSDAAVYEGITLRYRQLLGELNQLAAARSQVVLESAAAMVQVHKGDEACLPQALALFSRLTGRREGVEP